MAVKIESEGRRVYLTGDTYAVRDRIKAIGGRWDPDRRAWWVGSAKKAEAESLAAGLSSAEAPAAPEAEDPSRVKIVGKARYKGRTYYVRYAGETKRGYACRLTTLDGRVDFWADLARPGEACDGSGDVAVIVKTYRPREYRGREEYMTLASLQRFVEDAAKVKAGGECPRCRDRKPYYGSGDYEFCSLCGGVYAE